MRLKSLRIVREVDGAYTVTPQYFGRRGRTRTDYAYAKKGADLKTTVSECLVAIGATQNVEGWV